LALEDSIKLGLSKLGLVEQYEGCFNTLFLITLLGELEMEIFEMPKDLALVLFLTWAN